MKLYESFHRESFYVNNKMKHKHFYLKSFQVASWKFQFQRESQIGRTLIFPKESI